jgi:hypothetical protein
VQERGEVVLGEPAEGSEAVAEVVLGGVRGPAGDVVDEQVVDGDVSASVMWTMTSSDGVVLPVS